MASQHRAHQMLQCSFPLLAFCLFVVVIILDSDSKLLSFRSGIWFIVTFISGFWWKLKQRQVEIHLVHRKSISNLLELIPVRPSGRKPSVDSQELSARKANAGTGLLIAESTNPKGVIVYIDVFWLALLKTSQDEASLKSRFGHQPKTVRPLTPECPVWRRKCRQSNNKTLSWSAWRSDSQTTMPPLQCHNFHGFNELKCRLGNPGGHVTMFGPEFQRL